MKKFLATICSAVLAIAACFSAVACGGGNNDTDALKLINVKLTEENYAYAVNKNNAELLASANTYLAAIKEDGTFDAIVAKYFEGEGTPVGQPIGTYDASKEQLVVLTNTPFEPFEYVGNDGKYYGVDMEVAAGLATYLEMELCIIEHVNFDTICEEVSKYENGMVMAINGLYNDVVSWSASWMLYTNDAELSNTAWGTCEYQGEIYGSAMYGAESLTVKNGCRYIWVYQTF
jgi:polar amino acid transport system substrate-binding protein